MASLKVFVSSTCYDMPVMRSQLRSLLTSLGHEPVLGDQADDLYDPASHTHVNSLREVENCDMFIVIIASRFGRTTAPEALDSMDFNRLSELSRSGAFAHEKSNITISQAEVLTAIKNNIPIFSFANSGILRDRLTYEENKSKSFVGDINFPSIFRPDTARYVFEFVNFLRLRSEGNSIFDFARFEDIELQLKRQWSSLFQKMLLSSKVSVVEENRVDTLSSQIADLKTIVINSIPVPELKETVKGAIRYRHMIDLVYSLASSSAPGEARSLVMGGQSWDQLLSDIGIEEVVPGGGARHSILIRHDRSYYKVRLTERGYSRIIAEWESFRQLEEAPKAAIVNAVIEACQLRPSYLVRYYPEPYEADVQARVEVAEEEGIDAEPAT